MRNLSNERSPVVYAAIKLKNDIDLGNHSDALPWIEKMKALGNVSSRDVSEERWCADALQKVIERQVSSEITSAAESAIMFMNESIMSQQSLLSAGAPIGQDRIWEELAAAGYTTTSPLPQQAAKQPEQQKEEQPLRNDDDEMAETAGRLLERVADNTSEKFQNSQFLELMRRLRDREVRVDGDKMVDVSSEQTTSSSLPATATAPPEIDPMILNHSAQDFGMPFDSAMEQEVGLSRHSTNEPSTDEISDQFRYYPAT
jgi:hypothetical protein